MGYGNSLKFPLLKRPSFRKLLKKYTIAADSLPNDSGALFTIIQIK